MNTILAVMLFFLCYLLFWAAIARAEGFFEERRQDRMTGGGR